MSWPGSGGRVRARFVLTLLLALAFGCTADEITDTGAPGSPEPVLLVVSPDAAMLAPQQSTPFAAKALRSDSSVASVAIAWRATGGTIDSGGNFTAGSTPGSYRVIGSNQAGTLADTSAVTIRSGPSEGAVVVAAAGDIADCSSSGDEATARLLDDLPTATVITLGDNAYEDGSASDFANCYEPSWGRHKARTRPSPGNHEYRSKGAGGYFGYFGASAGDPSKGYYSFNLGEWHIISLNSNISMSAGSAQERWLRADLAASTQRCTLAYWHHPRFSSGTKHGSSSASQPLWQALYDYGAEIALAGHEHNYERFAPQTPTGAADAVAGIRAFVVGTGGRGHYPLGTHEPNSEASNGTAFGVLKLTLASGTYAWEFVPAAGATYTDSGSGDCHAAGGTGSPPPGDPPPSAPPPPPPPPPVGTSCLERGPATITLTGNRTSSYDRRSDLAAGTIVDANAASWTMSGTGAGARAGDADAICWHGGTITNTLSQDNSWATFHDAYAFMGYGSNMVVEDLRAHNFGDGIKWVEETSGNWTVRRVHLSDMHDDCVETDWVKGGRIEDVLFEGCFVFLATRPRSSLSGSVDGSQETIAVDRAVVWMKPIKNTYNMDPPNSTGAVFKVDNSSDSDSPRMRLRNIVLRVDVEPGSGNACLNPYNLVVESVNNTVVWTGSGDYPCLPLPQGWTLTRDLAVWNAAVADWKARHPGR
ncbi:MAG: metallophosphoesterase family protein [Gemmatimonadales bacterium]